MDKNEDEDDIDGDLQFHDANDRFDERYNVDAVPPLSHLEKILQDHATN